MFLFLHQDKGGDEISFFSLAHWFKSFCWRLLLPSTSKKNWKHCFCFSYHHVIKYKIVTQISFHPFFQLPMEADKYFLCEQHSIFCHRPFVFVKQWIEWVVFIDYNYDATKNVNNTLNLDYEWISYTLFATCNSDIWILDVGSRKNKK